MSDTPNASANGNNNDPLAQPNLAARLEGSQQVAQVILVALSDLRYPDWNPRTFFDEDEMRNLMDYITAGGRVPPIIIWLPSANATGTGTPPFDVISGKRRCEAYRRLGKTHIEAIKRDCTLEDAMFEAIASNRDSKPFWLNEYMAVEKIKLKFENVTQVDIIAHTGWPKKRVSYAINLIRLLNPTSRQLIDQPALKKVPRGNFSADEDEQDSPNSGIWRLPEKVACQLIPYLKKKPLPEAQTFAQQALQVMTSQQLTGPETKELLAWAASGRSLAQFNPTAKVKKARTASAPKPSPKETGISSHAGQSPAPVGDNGHSVPTVDPIHAEASVVGSQPAASDDPDFTKTQAWVNLIVAFGILWFMGWLGLKLIGWVIS
jgi:hypothetical protein